LFLNLRINSKKIGKLWKSKLRNLLRVKYIPNGIRIAIATLVADIDLYLSMLDLGAAEAARTFDGSISYASD
jgi:hypothetical protein